MKSIKLFTLILAATLIGIGLFSFKNEEPKKEYLIAHRANTIWTIIKPDLSESSINNESPMTEAKIINDISKEGWVLKEVSSTSPGYKYLYFERVKL